MKARSPSSDLAFPPQRFAALAPILLAALLVPPLAAQVTIPAQSASSRGENPEPETVTVAPPAPGSSLMRNSSVSRTPPPPPSTPVESAPPLAPRPGETVAAMQRVPAVTQNIDGAKIERLAELRRDLRIADAANVARITLRTDDLFLLSKPGKIDELAMPTLRRVLEFIELNEKQGVTLRSYYVTAQVGGEEGGEELAGERAAALLAWLRKESSIDPEQFRGSEPEPVRQPSPKAFATRIGDTEYFNRVEFILERD